MNGLALLKQEPNESVREYAYRVLLENIMSLHLVPGTAMSEKEVSEMMSISRTPVREAFIRLSQAGLLDVLPQRGTYVSKIDTAQIAEFRFLRLTLERAVMELACEEFPEEEMDLLEENLLQQEKVLNQPGGSKFYELDNEMHCIIFSGCSKPHIWQILQDANINYIRARVLNVSSNQAKLNILYDQHQKIVEAIAKHDKKLGIDIITKHINKVVGDVDLLRKEHPQYFQ